MWHLWLITSADPTTLPGAPADLWTVFGPWAATVIVMGGVIWWQRKEHASLKARLEQVEDERLALAERALPSLTRNSEALERAAALLADQAAQLRLSQDLLDEMRRGLRGGRS